MPVMPSLPRSLSAMLDGYRPQGDAEAADVARVRVLAQTAQDPWLRSLPLHVTASALIVHPGSGRMLLRWHQRQQAWLQVGGHADVRFVLATRTPGSARPENPEAPLRWLSPDAAGEATSEANLRVLLSRVQRLLAE